MAVIKLNENITDNPRDICVMYICPSTNDFLDFDYDAQIRWAYKLFKRSGAEALSDGFDSISLDEGIGIWFHAKDRETARQVAQKMADYVSKPDKEYSDSYGEATVSLYGPWTEEEADRGGDIPGDWDEDFN